MKNVIVDMSETRRELENSVVNLEDPDLDIAEIKTCVLGDVKFHFGKHKDKSIREVYETDEQYANWYYRNMMPSGSTRDMNFQQIFVEYLARVLEAKTNTLSKMSTYDLGETKFYFGKYSGYTIHEVFTRYMYYARWFAKNMRPTTSKKQEEFQAIFKEYAERYGHHALFTEEY